MNRLPRDLPNQEPYTWGSFDILVAVQTRIRRAAYEIQANRLMWPSSVAKQILHGFHTSMATAVKSFATIEPLSIVHGLKVTDR